MAEEPEATSVTPLDTAADGRSSRAAATEVTLTGGERVAIEGDIRVVESAIISAARGSIMELAWVSDARTGQRVGINPDHVLLLRELDTGP